MDSAPLPASRPFAFYNEFDPFASRWLANLVAAGHLPDGAVDTRSIVDLESADLDGVVQFHAFAGIGGWPYALRLAGWPADRSVWTGSCPCQPFSAAGKQGGAADERHLWPRWFRLIAKCRPDTIFGEQVEGAIGFGWLDRVFADLEAEGYACGAAVLGAHSVGAPHIRQRLFWVAESQGEQHNGRGHARGWQRELAVDGATGGLDDAPSEQVGRAGLAWQDGVWLPCIDGKARRIEPSAFPLADGVPARMGRLRAYGNAIVAPVAAEFVRAFLDA